MLQVCFNCYGNYTTDNVYQWDLNHVLEITGVTVSNAPTIHYTNKKWDTAIVVQSTLENDIVTAPIPNELLQEPHNIIAYVHIYNDNHAKTIEVVNIPLKPRAKPNDYQFTSNIDVMTFERLEQDMSNFSEEINTTLQACRDVISALALEVVNLDGGSPLTGEDTYDLNMDGGFPVDNT